MDLVYNLEGYNHEEALWHLLNESAELICCSPFLNKSVTLFEAVDHKRIHLITTLKPNKAEQIEKVDYFSYLFAVAKRNSLDLRISIDNHLHGKVYIGKVGDSYTRAIVTSANLTTAGMTENHEWGVSIDEQKVIARLEQQIKDAIEFQDITKEDLRRFNQEIEKKGYDRNKLPAIKNINLQLVRLLDDKTLVRPYFASNGCKYWLKPLGSKDDPFSVNEVLDRENQRLDFAKRPRSINVGDIVICYGVGIRKVLSVIQITDGPRQATKNEMRENKHLNRWKWCMYGQNKTLRYGKNWNCFDLTLRNLEEEFLGRYPEEKLTARSQSLGALRYHADKLQLNLNFAYYIIGKIMDRDG